MKKQRSASPSQAMPRSAPTRLHLGDDLAPVHLEEGVRPLVGELAVGLEMHHLEVEAICSQDRPDHRSRHSVAAVDDDLHRLHPLEVDEGDGLGAIVVPDVDLLERPAARAVPEPRLDLTPDLVDPGFAGERQGSLAQQLDAGVALRVVRRRDHRPAVELPRPDQVVEHLGRDHPRIEHRRALDDHAVADLGRHRRRIWSHVAAEPDAQLGGRLFPETGEDADEGAPDRERGRLVHLGPVDTADVVGLEDLRRREGQNAPASAS